MNEIVEFITDRMAERAAEAHLVHALGCDALSPCADGCCPMGTCDCGEPERILADIAAKRAILAAYVQAKADFDAAAPHARDVSPFDGGILTGHMVGLREAVTMLAAEFTGHPKYKPEWSVA